MDIAGVAGIGSIFGGGGFFGGGGGIIPDQAAYGLGVQNGNMMASLTASTPLAGLPSPANMDPAVTLFGMDQGPLGMIGGFLEDTASDILPIVGQIVGGIIGAYFGVPGLGSAVGKSAGEIAAGTVDSTSDAGIGIFDLDGRETRDQENGIVNWWRA